MIRAAFWSPQAVDVSTGRGERSGSVRNPRSARARGPYASRDTTNLPAAALSTRITCPQCSLLMRARKTALRRTPTLPWVPAGVRPPWMVILGKSPSYLHEQGPGPASPRRNGDRPAFPPARRYLHPRGDRHFGAQWTLRRRREQRRSGRGRGQRVVRATAGFSGTGGPALVRVRRGPRDVCRAADLEA